MSASHSRARGSLDVPATQPVVGHAEGFSTPGDAFCNSASAGALPHFAFSGPGLRGGLKNTRW